MYFLTYVIFKFVTGVLETYLYKYRRLSVKKTKEKNNSETMMMGLDVDVGRRWQCIRSVHSATQNTPRQRRGCITE